MESSNKSFIKKMGSGILTQKFGKKIFLDELFLFAITFFGWNF